MKKVAKKLEKMGQGGDTILAHINPEEAMALKAMGGSGKRNPKTGLLSFESDPEGNADAGRGDGTAGVEGQGGFGGPAFGGGLTAGELAALAGVTIDGKIAGNYYAGQSPSVTLSKPGEDLMSQAASQPQSLSPAQISELEQSTKDANTKYFEDAFNKYAGILGLPGLALNKAFGSDVARTLGDRSIDGWQGGGLLNDGRTEGFGPNGGPGYDNGYPPNQTGPGGGGGGLLDPTPVAPVVPPWVGIGRPNFVSKWGKPRGLLGG